jgi:hypothetical protein
MTFIPAARPAATPRGESSTTTQLAGGTPRLSAAARKMSGAGFPRATRGSSPQTIASKIENHSWWWPVLTAKRRASVLVATAMGMPRALSSRVNASAPVMDPAFASICSSSGVRSAR